MKRTLAWAIYTPRRAAAILAVAVTAVLFGGYTANFFREVRAYELSQARDAESAEQEAQGGKRPGAVVGAPDARDFDFDPPTFEPPQYAPPTAAPVEDDTVTTGPGEAAQGPAIREAAAAFTSAWLAGPTTPDRAAWVDAVAAHTIPAIRPALESTPTGAIPAAQLTSTAVTVPAEPGDTAEVRADLSTGDALTLNLVIDGSGWKVSYYGPAA